MEIKIKTAQGVPLSRIAAECGIDRKTARKLRDAESDPSRRIIRRRASRLDQHGSFIAERLRVGVPIAQIARDLARANIAVPYNTLWEFAVKLRAATRSPVEEVRFETPPAQQAQCDWSDFGTIVEDGEIRTLSLFVMLLGFSRHTFGCFSTSMDEISLQRCHVRAFEDFGGVPGSVLYDNMKTVSTGRDAEHQPIWQRDFADFAARYGFTPKCAQPYRAKTKGKVERAIGFIRRSFLPGRVFTDLHDANVQLAAWLAQVNMRRHGTHGELIHERYAKERALLTPLRTGMPAVERSAMRVVDAEGAITYAANVYELPRGYRGRTLLVREDGRRLRVYDGSALICERELLRGRGQRARRVPPDVVSLKERQRIVVERRALDVYDELAQ